MYIDKVGYYDCIGEFCVGWYGWCFSVIGENLIIGGVYLFWLVYLVVDDDGVGVEYGYGLFVVGDCLVG